MSSIPAVSVPMPEQGCLPSFITYPIDLITSVVSKIFALVAQFFSSIQEGLSRLFGWSATPVLPVNPVPVAAATVLTRPAEQRREVVRPDSGSEERLREGRERIQADVQDRRSEFESAHGERMEALQRLLGQKEVGRYKPIPETFVESIRQTCLVRHEVSSSMEQLINRAGLAQRMALSAPADIDLVLAAEASWEEVRLSSEKMQMITQEAMLLSQLEIYFEVPASFYPQVN